MKDTKQQILKQREKLEMLRLKDKYEDLGYSVYFNKRSKDKKCIADVYATNPLTGDRIVFEIKLRSELKKTITSDILEIRNQYLKSFKNTRFILVIPDEVEEKTPVESGLNTLIYQFIVEKYSNLLRENIDGFISLNEVQDLIIDYVNFNNFENITVKGNGNMRFIIEVLKNKFSHKSIADGIPFQFDLNLKIHEIIKTRDEIYFISNKSRIIFDLSEFN